MVAEGGDEVVEDVASGGGGLFGGTQARGDTVLRGRQALGGNTSCGGQDNEDLNDALVSRGRLDNCDTLALHNSGVLVHRDGQILACSANPLV